MADLLALVESRGIRMRRVGRKHGGEYAGGCPFCGDSGKTDADRFHIWPMQRSNVTEGTFWCRQCAKRGDTVSFIMQTSGVTFKEACLRLNIQMPESKALRTPAPKAKDPAASARSITAPAEIWRVKARKFVEHCFAAIWESPETLKWLAARGVPEDAIAKYGIGWNAKDYYRPRDAWGLDPVLKENGTPKKLWLPPGVVIPQFNGKEVWRVKIRRDGDLTFGARYYVVPGSAMGCLVLQPQRRVFVVVEAELDGIAIVSAAGDLVGAVPLGSAQAKPDEATARLLTGAMEILLAMDFDKAGAEAAVWWKEHYPKARLWPVPDGKDPGEAVKAGVDLRAWIMAGLPPAFHV